MSGYRDTSNYEPLGAANARPLRPFNWVQWTGVGFVVLGLVIDAFYFAGRLAWIREPMHSPVGAIGPIVLGVILVNSRRESIPDLAPDLAAQRKRWLLIVTLLCVVVLGAATIIEIIGA